MNNFWTSVFGQLTGETIFRQAEAWGLTRQLMIAVAVGVMIYLLWGMKR